LSAKPAAFSRAAIFSAASVQLPLATELSVSTSSSVEIAKRQLVGPGFGGTGTAGDEHRDRTGRGKTMKLHENPRNS
jgi:hypothetical protein